MKKWLTIDLTVKQARTLLTVLEEAVRREPDSEEIRDLMQTVKNAYFYGTLLSHYGLYSEEE